MILVCVIFTDLDFTLKGILYKQAKVALDSSSLLEMFYDFYTFISIYSIWYLNLKKTDCLIANNPWLFFDSKSFVVIGDFNPNKIMLASFWPWPLTYDTDVQSQSSCADVTPWSRGCPDPYLGTPPGLPGVTRSLPRSNGTRVWHRQMDSLTDECHQTYYLNCFADYNSKPTESYNNIMWSVFPLF